jgi:DNA polymerase I-like protein with 3'-5' exonuclease and polymerase domains
MKGVDLPTKNQQLAHLEVCSTFKYLAVDTEGYAPNILGISVAHPGLGSMYFPIGHKENVNIDPDVRKVLETVLQSVPYRIFHNAGHDINSLPYLWDLPFICTMIMGHMIDENLMSKGLDYMHKHYCNGEGKKRPDIMDSIIKTMGWEYVPYALMYGYATEDAKITMELFQTIKPLYEEQFGPIWS